jgi:hypothetical protein
MDKEIRKKILIRTSFLEMEKANPNTLTLTPGRLKHVNLFDKNHSVLLLDFCIDKITGKYKANKIDDLYLVGTYLESKKPETDRVDMNKVITLDLQNHPIHFRLISL